LAKNKKVPVKYLSNHTLDVVPYLLISATTFGRGRFHRFPNRKATLHAMVKGGKLTLSYVHPFSNLHAS